MKKTFLILFIVAFGVVAAQEENTTKNKTQDVSVTKKKNDKGNEVNEIKVTTNNNGKTSKTTIVIDGEKITVNGKPVEKLKDEDIDQLIERTLGELEGVAPKIRINGERMRNNFGPERIKNFKRSFNNDNNKAVLGVSSNGTKEGAIITKVYEESAAQKAGLKEGDIIVKVNELSVNEEMGLYKTIGKFKPEDKINITFKRDGKEKTTTVVLDKNKEEDIIEMEMKGDFDMPEMREMPFMNRGFNEMFERNKVKLGIKIQDVEEGDGVKLLEVNENSVAQKSGLLVNDIVTQINGEATKTVDAFKARTRGLKEGDIVKMQITRNGKTENIEVKFPKKLKTAEL